MAETKIAPFHHFHKQMRFLFGLTILPVLYYSCCSSSVISSVMYASLMVIRGYSLLSPYNTLLNYQVLQSVCQRYTLSSTTGWAECSITVYCFWCNLHKGMLFRSDFQDYPLYTCIQIKSMKSAFSFQWCSETPCWWTKAAESNGWNRRIPVSAGRAIGGICWQGLGGMWARACWHVG